MTDENHPTGAAQRPVKLTVDQIMSVLRKVVAPQLREQLTCKRWKDGIDIEEPTFVAERLAEEFIALAAQPPAAPVETDRQKLLDVLPLQFEEGPDYCTVRDAKGKDFALTVQPDILKEMESALRVALVASMSAPQSSAETVEADLPGHGETMANLDALQIRRL